MGGSASKKISPELVTAADTNKDGIISAEELGDMLRKAGEDWPDKRVEKLLGALDENGDGLVSLAEFKKGVEQLLAAVGALHSMGVEQQPATVHTGPAKAPQPSVAPKPSAKVPPPSFAALIAAGTVVPDECDGPYALACYHANVSGVHRGYKSAAGQEEWMATNEEKMTLQTSWATIDFGAENAVDPEYMFSYGAIDGGGVRMEELRPTVIKAQKGMVTGYSGAFKSARGKRGAAKVYKRIEALPEKSGKVRQPGGEQLDLIGLYKGALGAVGELWEYGQQATVASSEAGVAASWGLKKVRPSLRCALLTLSPTYSP